MLARFANALAAAAERFVPSAFAIAILLTLVTFGAAAALAGATPSTIVMAWGRGFWTLSPFAMQMALVVLNFAFLMLAMLPHRSVASLMAAGEQGARLLAGVVLQFPLYAGMYGVIDFA